MAYKDSERQTLPYQGHSSTSGAAAESMRESAEALRERVYQSLLLDGPQTDDELQVRLHMAGHTESARRVELMDAGRVVETEARRRTRTGRFAVVWRARTAEELASNPAPVLPPRRSCKAQLDAAIALAQYAQHRAECGYLSGQKCTCGLVDAYQRWCAALEGQKS